ncbi:HD-GYP domain-containing protein [Caproiciproducens galactitolivorans]|nr:HD-GYP domain-containing protein [Caproiciproducens galactitolivorans]
MAFVPINKLKPGMILDRDIYLYNNVTSKVMMLRSGQVLSEAYIERLHEFDILGAYIRTNEERTRIPSLKLRYPIKKELRQEALLSLKQVYKMFNQGAQRINVRSINQTMNISKKLVNSLKCNVEAKISIANLKLYDDYTYNHSLGVSILSIAIGLELGLKTQELYDLGLCALLHDIGKMAVPISIISKPAKLTEEEFNIVKQHPSNGALFFLKHHLANKSICEGILTHHEKYDGTGYPRGLSGEDIPLFGRIISVADVYDALTSVRPYRKPSTPTEAIEYIMGSSGIAFDLKIVKAFLNKVAPYPIGSCVKLSNGEVAIIVKQNDFNPIRPIIRLLKKPDVLMDLCFQRDVQNIVIEDICTITTEP